MKTLINDASAVTSLLTVISAIPYEKDIMGLIPPAWAPRVLLVAAIATVILRILHNRLPADTK